MGRKAKMAIQYVLTSSLSSHPLNERLYGKMKCTDDGFIKLGDSIKQHGILEPLVVTPDSVIISGHSRKQVADALQLFDVPVVVVKPADDLALEEMLIHSNRQREKTNSQRAAEARELLRIEKERAKARQGERNDLNNIQENVPECSSGQARDKAAAAVGWSGRTAEKAVAVVDAIDEAEEAGDEERVVQLKTALDKSVSSAFNVLHEPDDEEDYEAEDYEVDPVQHYELGAIKRAYSKLNTETKAAFCEWLDTVREKSNG